MKRYIVLFTLLLFARLVTAQIPEFVTKLTATDGEAEDYFATGLALHGDYLVAGAYGHQNGQGAVYVFKRQPDGTWIETAKLMADDGAPDDWFGDNLAFDGTHLFVAARRNDEVVPNAGAVYLFERNGDTWTQQAKFTPDTDRADGFGSSLALDGDVVLIGAGRDYVTVLERQGDTWINKTQLEPFDPTNVSNFASHYLEFRQGYALVPDNADDIGGENSGVVYVYKRNADDTWSTLTKLLPDDIQPDDRFGVDVVFDGQRALITNLKREAYLFVRDGDTWDQQYKFEANGYVSAGLAGSLALLGTASGPVHIFKQVPGESTWMQQALLTSSDPASDAFGFPILSAGSTLLLGAITDDEQAEDAGAVYVYTLPNSAPASPQLVAPAPGAMIDLAGDPAQPFSIRWNAATDSDGDLLTYSWQFSLTDDFANPMLDLNAGSNTILETDYGTIAGALTEAGIATGAAVTAYHRVIVSDGIAETTSAALPLALTRGMLTSTEADGWPDLLVLHPAYPNPFNPQTTLRYTLPASAHVRLAVYDVLGREVAVLAEGVEPAGTHAAVFEAEHLPAGLYVLRMQTGAFSQSQRVMLVK